MAAKKVLLDSNFPFYKRAATASVDADGGVIAGHARLLADREPRG